MTALCSLRSSLVRAASLLAVGLFIAAAAATPTQAMRHLRLVRSAPMADSMVATSPAAISLWMSEPTDAAISKISLASADGKAVPLGAITRAAAADAPLVAKVPSTLANGAYTVTWKAMSKDGHVVDGAFKFHVHTAQ